MYWKFENNRWWYQLDFERFPRNINGKIKQVSIKNIFNKIRGSWIEEIDFWQKVWNDYFDYYNVKTQHDPKFSEYFTKDDYQKYDKCRNDFIKDLYFNERLINDAEKHGKYEINRQCYESIKYIVEHLNWYKSTWLPLDPSYKKPIKKSKNPAKNIILRDITLTNPNLGLEYLRISNSLDSRRRRGRPRKEKIQIYHPDLYGF